MKILRRSDAVQTEAEAEALLAAMDDFINNPYPGKAPPHLTGKLMEIWNDGNVLEWTWEDEPQDEYDQRISREEAEDAELQKLMTDIEYFKDVKIRPWRNQKLVEWIDDTFIKPLKYQLTSEQEIERILLRERLLDWPDVFTGYKTDEEIDALKLSAPIWIIE